MPTPRTTQPSPAALPSGVSWLLRAEGAAILGLALYLYADAGAGWWLFALLILAPDLSMAGYLRGPRLGAIFYNAAHTYIAPAVAWFALDLAGSPLALPVALVWAAHIGLDRLLGYGLKFPDSFRRTHLTA